MFIIFLKKFKYFVPLILYSGLIFIVSGIEKIPYLEDGITYEDKILHFFAYLVYGICIIFALVNSDNINTNRLNILVLSIGVLWAASDEYHQSFVPGRSAELLDLLADSLGVACSLILKRLVLWIKLKIG